MLNHRYIYIGLILFFIQITVSGQNSLSGRITDRETGESLPGAAIYLPDIKMGTVSDKEGHYTLKDLPGTFILVQVTYLGYKAAVTSVDIRETSLYDFKYSLLFES